MLTIDCPGERRVRENRTHGVGGGGRKRADDARPVWIAGWHVGGAPLAYLTELGVLLSPPGQGGRDPQAAWRWGPSARRADDRRPGRTDGRGHVVGAVGGAEVPPGLLWLSAGKSAHDALAVCRERCWKFDWAIDLDVQSFFDAVPWDLMIEAVRAVTDCRWVLLYVKRWLAAPLRTRTGRCRQRERELRKGSAISPCLANLFMHYAFDIWMVRNYPGCPV